VAESNLRPQLSVVVPCYGCESCLHALHAALVEALTPLVPSFELILVDDRSKQGDWRVISELAAKDPRVRGVRLNRNFGQHSAIAAGLAYAEGHFVAVMDCDLQDPPKELHKLYARAVAGVPVVFARRLGRKVGLLKRFNSWAFAKVHAVLGGFKTDAGIGNYSVLARRVVLQLRQFKERTRNYGMHVGWLGFQTEFVDIESAARHSGESTYTLGKQLKHALSTILSQSTRPLYLSAGVGFFFSSSSALYALYLVGRKVMMGVSVEGWTSVMVGLFFLSGVMMVNMGVLGLYLGNVFLDVKGRPTFVVEETTFDEDTVTR
jgi:glycosyltransferase involved in cell wall biosynthesis